MIIEKIFFILTAAFILLFVSGCSETEKSQEVKIQKNNLVLIGKIRCPRCWKYLQKNEIIAEKPPLSRCKLCRKLAPTVRFYPEVKTPERK